jgi:hypothetical protein
MMRQSALVMLGACCIAAASPLALAASEGDCARQWKSADADGDGILQDLEAKRYLAFYRVQSAKAPEDERISEAEFMRACRDDVFVAKAVEPGAPRAGVSGFTEGQAKDYAMAAGYSSVSSLVRDGDGVWHGSAMKGGKMQKIAIDEKGNVAVSNE